MEYKIKRRRKHPKTTKTGTGIPATEAAKTFGRLVDRVREAGATYIIERHGRPVAQIGPIAPSRIFTVRDFADMITTLPPADEEFLHAVEEAVAMFNEPRVPENPWER